MPADMFLKLTGIDGESKDEGHEKEIDILSWSWGVSQQGSHAGGGGGGAGKVSMNDFSFVHRVDKASPKLIAAACQGKHLDSAIFTVRSSSPDFEQRIPTREDFLVIKLTDVLVTSVSSGGTTGGDDSVMEAVSLNFHKMEMSYTAGDQEVVGSTC